MKTRFDKFVWSVRLAKTRSKSADRISKGKILLNHEKAKPSKEVKKGDIVVILEHSSRLEYKIIELLDKRVGAKLVENYIVDITAPEELEKLRLYRLAQRSYREKGEGKPTKKDRRSLDDYLNNWE